jgi:hypothetical protein
MENTGNVIPIKSHQLVFQTLVDAGGHLEATTSGETVISILKNATCEDDGRLSNFDFVINGIFPLSWYFARVIWQNGIPFHDDRLPFTLQTFVSFHSSARGKMKKSKIVFFFN